MYFLMTMESPHNSEHVLYLCLYADGDHKKTGRPKTCGRRFQTLFFKLFRLRTGLAKIFHVVCSNSW